MLKKAAGILAKIEMRLNPGDREGYCNPAAVKRMMRTLLRGKDHESFVIICLDSQHRLLTEPIELFRGTIDGASVYPREVVKVAIQHGAAAVMFAHNHPSGIAEPSLADRHITKRLTEALQLIDVRVLDHLIVGETSENDIMGVISFAERGLI